MLTSVTVVAVLVDADACVVTVVLLLLLVGMGADVPVGHAVVVIVVTNHDMCESDSVPLHSSSLSYPPVMTMVLVGGAPQEGL